MASLHQASFLDIFDLWEWVERKFGAAGKAALGRCDRFYLLTVLLHRRDALHPWLYTRCREVEREPDDCLDLWARFHYKSTIITFAGGIQEMVVDPEITIGVFSHTRPTAVKFLKQIKQEIEQNEELRTVYSDVFWANPRVDASRAGCSWTDYRIDVKRETNPKEGTLEAHGLVDGQPIGAHFKLRIYEDVVTKASVSTPEMVNKTTEAWELSDNLRAHDSDRRWHIGTRYSFADTYAEIMERKILKPRIYPATDDGTLSGKPVFLLDDAWGKIKATQKRTVAAQMLQNPVAGDDALFEKGWLRFIDIRPATLNVYILVDPASSKKKTSDRTAMAVIGIDYARNKFLLDGYCHKMDLSERWLALRDLRRYWLRQPGVQQVFVGYERFGSRADLEHFEVMMRQDGESFDIKELNWPQDGEGAKFDRIQRLEPDHKAGKFYLPADIEMVQHSDGSWVKAGESSNQRRMREQGEPFRILKVTRRKDHQGNIYSLNQMFLNEYLFYPFSKNDDFLDACSRIYDMDYQPPVLIDQSTCEPETFCDS